MRKNLLTIGMALAVSCATVFTSVAAVPAPPYGSTLSVLNGGNPNGAWQLFVQDDTSLDSGTNYDGWILNLTLASPVAAAGDNQVVMTSQTPTVPFGSNIVYVLSVTNYGPSSSTNVQVTDTLPSGAILVSSNFTAGSFSGTQWNLGALAINQGATLTLTVHPGSNGGFVNTATVSASTPDPNPDDDTASALVTVTGTAPSPVLGTNGLAMAGRVFHFSVTSQPNQTNVVLWSTNLLTWNPIYTNVGSFIFTNNTFLTSYPNVFFLDRIWP